MRFETSFEEPTKALRVWKVRRKRRPGAPSSVLSSYFVLLATELLPPVPAGCQAFIPRAESRSY